MATTIYTTSLDADESTNYADYHIRMAVTPTGDALDQIRITCSAHATLSTWVDNVGIGIHNGTAYNTTATPVELKWAGVSGFQLTAGASTGPSDWANLTGFTTSDLLIIGFDISSSNGKIRVDSSPPGPGSYGVAAASNYYATAAPGGAVAFVAAQTPFITLIEVQTTPAAGGAVHRMTILGAG